MRKKTAEQLKCRIIDYLLQIYPGIIIGNEIMFGSSRNAVDLLVIQNDKLIAIEIKSKDDNLKRLPEQLKEYTKVYDKVIIFCSQDKIEETRNIIYGSPIGLYSISDNQIKALHASKMNYSTLKEEMLASMPASYLKKEFNMNWKTNSDGIRLQLASKSKKQIHGCLLRFYKEKIIPSFNLYMKDKGEISVIDDIPLLSKESIIL